MNKQLLILTTLAVIPGLQAMQKNKGPALPQDRQEALEIYEKIKKGIPLTAQEKKALDEINKRRGEISATIGAINALASNSDASDENKKRLLELLKKRAPGERSTKGNSSVDTIGALINNDAYLKDLDLKIKNLKAKLPPLQADVNSLPGLQAYKAQTQVLIIGMQIKEFERQKNATEAKGKVLKEHAEEKVALKRNITNAMALLLGLCDNPSSADETSIGNLETSFVTNIGSLIENHDISSEDRSLRIILEESENLAGMLRSFVFNQGDTGTLQKQLNRVQDQISTLIANNGNCFSIYALELDEVAKQYEQINKFLSPWDTANKVKKESVAQELLMRFNKKLEESSKEPCTLKELIDTREEIRKHLEILKKLGEYQASEAELLKRLNKIGQPEQSEQLLEQLKKAAQRLQTINL